MLGNTMIYVTHDQTEALTMADRIVVLRAGNVEQVGTPMQLYLDPDSAFVAGFIGSPRMNFLPAVVTDAGRLKISGIEIDNPTGSRLQAGQIVDVGIRPEHLDLSAGTGLDVTVDVVEQLGSTAYLHATLPTGETIIAERRSAPPKVGDRVTLYFAPESLRVFSKDGARLR